MEHHPTWIGNLVNWLLGGLVGPLLEAVGIHPHDPARPIPDHIATELFIVVLCVLFFLWFRARLSADNPGALQLCFEQLLSNSFRVGIYDLLDEIVGHHGRRHLSMVGTVGLFVLFCNSISLIPNTMSPTAQYTVPLGCALVVFAYYNLEGLRTHGAVGYGKHFIGPALASPWWLWPIMIPLLAIVETVSNLARLLSLTVRLWVNMVVSEMVYLIFLGLGLLAMVGAWEINKAFGGVVALMPLGVPLLFVALHIFVAFLQAFVFTLLPIVYVGGAVAEEH